MWESLKIWLYSKLYKLGIKRPWTNWCIEQEEKYDIGEYYTSKRRKKNTAKHKRCNTR